MRREERVTVQGPVKEQQPDGMSHKGGELNITSDDFLLCFLTLAPLNQESTALCVGFRSRIGSGCVDSIDLRNL